MTMFVLLLHILDLLHIYRPTNFVIYLKYTYALKMIMMWYDKCRFKIIKRDLEALDILL